MALIRSCAVILLAILACAIPTLSPLWAQTPRRGGELRIAHTGEPPTLDQHWTTAGKPFEIMGEVTEGLFVFNSKFEPKPMLVDTWSMSPDRRTFTFTLRRGVKFHNMKDLTSEDVKASLERWARLSSRFRGVFEGATITAPDPRTVVLKLRNSYGLVPLALAVPSQAAVIYSKEVIDEAGTGQLKRYISTGPYKFVEWLPDRHIRLERFDAYTSRAEEPDGYTGRKAIHFDSIMVLPVRDPAVRIAGVKRGDYHFAWFVPQDQYDRLRTDPDLDPILEKDLTTLAAVFNNRAGLMANKKIRQAFQAAVDHEAVMRGAVGNPRLWHLDPSFMPKEHYMWSDAGKEYYNVKNPERARQLLQDSGYKGEPLRWLTSMEFPELGTSAQVMKPMLERVGFTIDLQISDQATVNTRRTRPDLWDVFSNSFDFTPDPTLLTLLAPAYSSGFDNKDVNALMTLLRSHADPKVRRDLWNRAQKIWYEEAGSINFGKYPWLHVQRKGVKGVIDFALPKFWNASFER